MSTIGGETSPCRTTTAATGELLGTPSPRRCETVALGKQATRGGPPLTASEGRHGHERGDRAPAAPPAFAAARIPATTGNLNQPMI